MMKMTKKGIYIHIPFCDKKCSYCDFTTMIGQEEKREFYTQLLLKEIDLYKDNTQYIDTVYLGGGTPSLLPSSFMKMIIDKIQDSFIIAENSEITIEANPNTIDLKKIIEYRKMGINRISLGVQCFQRENLKLLGRNYDPEKVVEDVRLIREGGIDNLSLDMIYGIPNQNSDHIKEDLFFIDQLKPDHISWYNLIIEEKTVFGSLYRKGKLSLPSEEEESDIYLFICEELRKRNYKQYELSNFAKKDRKSKHNLKYWHNEEYYGFGLGASGYLRNLRYKNHSNYNTYADLLRENKKPIGEKEDVTEETKRFEYIIMHMRLNEGISIDEYKKIFGVDLYKENKMLIDGFIRSGHLEDKRGIIAFTREGYFISNYFLTKINY